MKRLKKWFQYLSRLPRYWMWHRWFGHGRVEYWKVWPPDHCRRCYHERDES